MPTIENEEDHTDLACLSFRCRCCGGRWGTVRLTFYNLAVCCIYRQNGQGGRSTSYSGHRRATAAVDAESSPCGLLVLNGTTRQLAQHLTALFSLWTVNGPFLFSLAREKRNGGFKPPSYGIAEINAPRRQARPPQANGKGKSKRGAEAPQFQKPLFLVGSD